jgi:hypothetical protein
MGAAASAAALAIIPRNVLGGAGHTPPSETVNLGCIGVGNRGWQLIQGMQHHNIVALCDVDARHLAQAADRFPKANTYRDFRHMLDKEQNSLDAAAAVGAGVFAVAQPVRDVATVSVNRNALL